MTDSRGNFDIEIVVPTYNCGQWIDEFVESILNQDYENWRVIVRDDGSTDDTVERVKAWSAKLGERVKVIENEEHINLGAVGSYNLLLDASTADWIMLGDPDDVWKPNKISLTKEAMIVAERSIGTNNPVVIFTDAEVVDESGRQLAESYWKWSRLNPNLAVTFHRMIVESGAISSTMMVNRAALNLALPVEGSSAFQDW